MRPDSQRGGGGGASSNHGNHGPRREGSVLTEPPTRRAFTCSAGSAPRQRPSPAETSGVCGGWRGGGWGGQAGGGDATGLAAEGTCPGWRLDGEAPGTV